MPALAGNQPRIISLEIRGALMKMSLNVGNGDRAIRVVAGCVLIGFAFSPLLTGSAAMVVYIIGAVAILTGVVRFCPAYTLFGLDTGAKEPRRKTT